MGALLKLTKIVVTGQVHLTGDISCLKPLQDLKTVILAKCIKVSGDISCLSALLSLTNVTLNGCKDVRGDITHLSALRNLEYLGLVATGVTAPAACPKDRDGDLNYATLED